MTNKYMKCIFKLYAGFCCLLNSCKCKPCTCGKNNDYCKCTTTKEQIKRYN